MKGSVDGFEPDDNDQRVLVELWHLSRTALAGSTRIGRVARRLRWCIDQFAVKRQGEPGVAYKWIYVWAEEYLGRLVQPSRARPTRWGVRQKLIP